MRFLFSFYCFFWIMYNYQMDSMLGRWLEIVQSSQPPTSIDSIRLSVVGINVPTFKCLNFPSIAPDFTLYESFITRKCVPNISKNISKLITPLCFNSFHRVQIVAHRVTNVRQVMYKFPFIKISARANHNIANEMRRKTEKKKYNQQWISFIYMYFIILNRIESRLASTVKKIRKKTQRHTFEEALTNKYANICTLIYSAAWRGAGFIKSKCKDNHKVKSTVENQIHTIRTPGFFRTINAQRRCNAFFVNSISLHFLCIHFKFLILKKTKAKVIFFAILFVHQQKVEKCIEC